MKADEPASTPTPAPLTPTPVQTYTSQWASTPLQQTGQHPTPSYYQPYTSHYPQAAYATHYQAYAPQAAAASAAGTPQQVQSTIVRPVTAAPAAYQTSTYNLGTAAAVAAANANAAANSAAGGMDTADVATLNDALGSAGVDLRAEEESLQRSTDPAHHPLTSSAASLSHQYRPYEDRTRKQPPRPSFPTHVLGPTMRTIGTQHKITRVPEDSVNYLALALRARLQDLVVAMVGAAQHRVDAQFDRPASFYGDEDGGAAAGASASAAIKIEVDAEEEEDEEGEGAAHGRKATPKDAQRTPMWSIVVRKDVAKQLGALEKIEREEELRARKERKERAELTAAHAAALAAQAAGLPSSANASGASAYGGMLSAANASTLGGSSAMDVDADGDGSGGTAKKKRKKDGPGVTARNMSEDVRKKMSNAVATQAAGLGGKYSWMTAANAAAAGPVKPKPTASAATPGAGAGDAPGTPGASGTAAGTASTTTAAGTAAATSSWARPYIPTKKPGFSSSLASGTPGDADGADGGSAKMLVTMRDAMFVVEKERGHGGGKGAARGWV